MIWQGRGGLPLILILLGLFFINRSTQTFSGADKRSFSSGKKVTVSNRDETTSFSLGDMTAFHKLTLGIPISLNRESEEGLTAIPGIGSELAKAIVRERSKRDGFKEWEEILSIRGIGPKLFNKIKAHAGL